MNNPKTVLLAEENIDNCTVYRTVLEHFGYTVLEARDAENALRMARQHQPLLILLSRSLWPTKGWDATSILKSDPRTRRIPIIGMSADALPAVRQEAEKAGCDAFLAKPCEPRRVVAEVEKFIGPGTYTSTADDEEIEGMSPGEFDEAEHGERIVFDPDMSPRDPGHIRILLIGQKFIERSILVDRSVLAKKGIYVSVLSEWKYDKRFVYQYLDFDVVIAPYRLCVLHLALHRSAATRPPVIIIATGSSQKLENLVSGRICDAVISDVQLRQGLLRLAFSKSPRRYVKKLSRLGVIEAELIPRVWSGGVPEVPRLSTYQVSDRAFVDFLAYVQFMCDTHKVLPAWHDQDLSIALPEAQAYYQKKCLRDNKRKGFMIVKPMFPEIDLRQTTRFELAFMLMPFDSELSSLYTEVIKPAVEACGVQINRADDFFTTGSVMNDIWMRINASGFVIADLTHRNPNVFYELGIAHTLGKPAILLAQSIEDVPFDIRDKRVIIYSTRYNQVPKLQNALRESIEHLREKQKEETGLQ